MLKHVRFQLEELWHHGHERFQRHLGGDQHQRLRGHFSRGAWDLVGWICCDIPFVGKVNKKHCQSPDGFMNVMGRFYAQGSRECEAFESNKGVLKWA